jgi:hypothetical protein
MSPLPKGSQRSSTVQDVGAWLLAAQERRAQLHSHAASSLESDERQAAFTAMSALLLAALEKVRIMRDIMRELTRAWSQPVQSDATDLRTPAAPLIAQCAQTMARTAPFASPPPEAIQEAESRLLALFKGEAVPRQA